MTSELFFFKSPTGNVFCSLFTPQLTVRLPRGAGNTIRRQIFSAERSVTKESNIFLLAPRGYLTSKNTRLLVPPGNSKPVPLILWCVSPRWISPLPSSCLPRFAPRWWRYVLATSLKRKGDYVRWQRSKWMKNDERWQNGVLHISYLLKEKIKQGK